MAKPIYKLTDQEVSDKVSRLINKLRLSGSINNREAELLRSILGRYNFMQGQVESTNKWAQEAFAEIEGLTKLLRDRWEAGWQGDVSTAE